MTRSQTGYDESPDQPGGRVLPVVRAPAAVLTTSAGDVDPTDPAIVQLAADLVATMRVNPGCVGLAAPQVGVSSRVFCVDVSTHPHACSHHGTRVLCNAEIVSASRSERIREGCLSLGDLAGDVERATRVVVRGQAPGRVAMVEIAADACEARALQHQIDHCSGLLFLDRIAGAHALHARTTYL